MKQIASALRPHLHFLILIPLLIIVMTWPTVVRIFDQDGFWLVQDNIDFNMLMWDAWYLEQMIAGRADYFFTDLLFHPIGVSLAFHNFSLPHMAVLAFLKVFLPTPNALNLTYLLLVFLNAAAGYVYLNYLFRDKWIALFGTVVFGASAFSLVRPAQVHISFMATVPLSLYFLHRGVIEERLRLILVAGVLIGSTAFIGMYTLVCLLIMVGMYIVAFGLSRWQMVKFWLSVALLLCVGAAVASLRVYPMISDPAGLSGALAKNEGFEIGTDLMWYFINYKHPILAPILHDLFPIVDTPGWDRIVYLGYVPLALLALALWQRATRRQSLPWLIAALVFLVLRLGSTLTVNSTRYDQILLPKYYLTELFPQIFKPFWTPDIFHGGALFPLAVLACLGLTALMKVVPTRRRRSVILLLAGAVAFEYYQAQRPLVLPEGRLAFIDWLSQEDDQAGIHLINLPMGGQHSKVYDFYQSINGYPHVEGRPTRTPPAAFDYIEANLLLSAWRSGRPVNCRLGVYNAYIAAQAQLIEDGFTHVILHRDRMRSETVAVNFAKVPAAYSDEFVSIFRVRDLHEHCANPPFMSINALPHLQQIEASNVIPLHGSAVLSIHPYVAASGDSTRPFPAALIDLHQTRPVPLDLIRSEGLSTTGDTSSDAQSVLDAMSVVVLVYDPRSGGSDLIDGYRSWLLRHFQSCGAIVEADDIVFEYFLRQGFPCALALSENSVSVKYEFEIELRNVVSNINGTALDLFLMWSRLALESHAISIQFFDAAGSKALGQDFVIGRAPVSDPIAHHRIDLASLPAGEYSVKLILYNFETQVSLSGVQSRSQESFDRELEIARIDWQP